MSEEMENNQEVLENNEEIVQEQSLNEKIEAMGDQPQDKESVEVQPQEEVSAELSQDEYKANYGYKVNGEELKFDDRFHDMIKTKEDEDYFRDLFQKHGGFDQKSEKLDKYRDDYTQLAQTVNGVLDARDSGDYQTMFNALNLKEIKMADALQGLGYSKQDIIQYAYDLATLTEEQEASYNTTRDLELQNRKLVAQQEQFMNNYNVQRQHTAQSQLDAALSRPEIAPIVNNFDTKNGKDSFWNEIVNRGVAYHSQHGQDADISWLVSDTISKFGLSAQMAQQMPQSTGNLSANQPLKVIPNTGSSSQAPAKKAIRTIKDIEAEFKAYTSN